MTQEFLSRDEVDALMQGVARLGFTVRDDPDDPQQVVVAYDLARRM